MSEELQDFMNREFYIVDCKNFIYYPRVVKVIGFECAYGEEIQFVINITEPYSPDRNRQMYKSELERFKTFDKAKKYAEKLNLTKEEVEFLGALYNIQNNQTVEFEENKQLSKSNQH